MKTLGNYLDSNTEIEILRSKIFIHEEESEEVSLYYYFFDRQGDILNINDGYQIRNVKSSDYLGDFETDDSFCSKLCLGMQKARLCFENNDLDEGIIISAEEFFDRLEDFV